jgi:hypothetical protein
MSNADPTWQEWAEKAAADAAWQAKCHEMAGQIQREQLASESAKRQAWREWAEQQANRLAAADTEPDALPELWTQQIDLAGGDLLAIRQEMEAKLAGAPVVHPEWQGIGLLPIVNAKVLESICVLATHINKWQAFAADGPDDAEDDYTPEAGEEEEVYDTEGSGVAILASILSTAGVIVEQIQAAQKAGGAA